MTRVISVVFRMIIQKCDPGHKCSVIRLSTYPALVAHYMFLSFCFLMHLLPLCRLTLMPLFFLIMSDFGEVLDTALPKKQRSKDFAANYHDIGTYLIAQPDLVIHYIFL